MRLSDGVWCVSAGRFGRLAIQRPWLVYVLLFPMSSFSKSSQSPLGERAPRQLTEKGALLPRWPSGQKTLAAAVLLNVVQSSWTQVEGTIVP